MRILRFVTAIAILLIMAACGARMQSPPEEVAPIEVSAVWLRSALADGNSAVYMNITNNTNQPITLTNVTTDFTDVVQIHQTTIENNMAQMQHMDNGLRIGADNMLQLQPSGYHIMLMNIQSALNEGDTVTLNLEFDTGEIVTVEALVSLSGNTQE